MYITQSFEYLGGDVMKVDAQKVLIARANLCLSSKQLQEAAQMPRGTYLKVISGRSVRPETAGKIAKALGVDVTEILKNEE